MNPERSRMKFRIRTILSLGFVFVIGLRAGTVAFGIMGARQLAANNERVSESVELLARFNDLSSNLKVADSAHRGYVLTGHHDFLAPFHAAAAETNIALSRLEQLATSRIMSPAGIDSLKKFVCENIDEMKRTVTARESKGQEAAAAIVNNGRVRAVTNAITPLIGELEKTVRDQLARRTVDSAATIRQALGALLATTVLVLLFAVGMYWFLLQVVDDHEKSTLTHQMRAEAEHRESLRREQENTQRLQELAQELRANDHSKDEFLAMLAHELRNPLAAISNAITVGRHQSAPQNSLWGIDVIDRQTHRLTRLIDDLLDISRITKGKIRLRRESVDLASIATDAAEAVRPLFEQRHHTLETVIPPTKLWVDGDATRLEQIFSNLLTNAAKYTKSGGQIRLTIALDGTDIVIRIRDSGIGISPDLLPRIFDLFTQGDRSLARAEGGLGIGLTLVRSLTELHGGSVSVVSDGLDAGTEFLVRLPALLKPALEPANDHAGDRAEHAHRPVRILVVDDNVDLANGLSRLISQFGHVVKTTFDGPAAIEAACTFRPEVVLLDIGLPAMDGYEVAACLRALNAIDSLVLVAISGYGQDEDRRRSLEAGFDFHLVKPIDLDALRQIINQISRSERPSRGKAACATPQILETRLMPTLL
jgi:signal transduction histidine kinase/FixJ family two-component response regulator